MSLLDLQDKKMLNIAAEMSLLKSICPVDHETVERGDNIRFPKTHYV